jgi:DNA-binding transcriptional LysR family regulator
MHSLHIMNIKQLEHFLAVAEEGSIAAAAPRAHLTQPALTRSIQALEAQVGFTLFDRNTRGVVLTAMGRLVLDRAKRILFEANCLERDLLLVQRHEMGRVRFGLGPLAAPIFLADALIALQRDWPKLEVTAEVNDGGLLMNGLREERFDFVVVDHRFVPTTTDLEVRRLANEHTGCFVRAGHPLVEQEISLAQLRRAPFASVPLPESVRAKLRKAFGCRPGEDLQLLVESNDFRVLVLLASRSDVILLAPLRAVAAEVAVGTLVQLPLPQSFKLAARFEIVHLAGRTLSPAAERTVSAVESADRMATTMG